MALPIAPTPTLTGKAAEDFIKQLAKDEAYRETPEGKEACKRERERLEANYEKFKKLLNKSDL